MLSPKISVIIPVYNVEHYVRKCIESVLSQTFDDINVILINDGSTDSSGKICDEYPLIDDRVQVIHQDNMGVGKARNKGIEASLAEYVYFIDPDDWIEPNTLRDNYELIKKCSSDLVVFGYSKEIILNGKCKDYYESKLTKAFLNGKENVLTSFPKIMEQGGRLSIWNKLFKLELIKKNNLQFPHLKRGQDMYFYLSYLAFTSSIVVNPKIYYRHYSFYKEAKFDFATITTHLEIYKKMAFLYKDLENQAFYNYKTKLFASWFLFVIPANIIRNINFSFKEKLILIKKMLGNKDFQKSLNNLRIRRIESKPIQIAIILLKSNSSLVIYLTTKTLINLNRGISRKIYNS